MKRKCLITLVLVGLLGLAQAQNNSNANNSNSVKSATALCRVQGDGRKVAAVVLEYDTPISTKSLSAQSFAVEGQEVTRVYANTKPELADEGVNGAYVIVELKTEVNLNPQFKRPTPAEMEQKKERDRMQGGPGLRAGWSTGGNDDFSIKAVCTQTANIKRANGKALKPDGSRYLSG